MSTKVTPYDVPPPAAAPVPATDQKAEMGLLSLAPMSPDFNNDGVVDATEAAVYKQMMDADVDGDGFLTRTEVYNVIAGANAALEEAPVRLQHPAPHRGLRGGRWSTAQEQLRTGCSESPRDPL